jgi:tRNA modification GTPase
MSDTIFALSSGAPPAAIAIVRISGPRADAALQALCGRLPPARQARVADLYEGSDRLDRAVVLRFPGSASATGEDVAELHLHGGRAVVARVLEALERMAGLRAAEPGEFTRRAFENGRIDLAEAEGLADLLAAETESQRRAALAAAGGALSRQVEAWRQRLLGLAAGLEAAIDFSDEGEVGEAVPAGWAEECAALARELQAFLRRPPVERLRDGIRVAVAGPPNAGKSSLINYLAEREAAIVTPVPGTTRDLIEVPVAIGGTPFVLIDTAGLRETTEEVEAIGVELARQSLAGADIVLWLGPVEERPLDRGICVQSKRDEGAEARPGVEAYVSARTGEGIPRLIALVQSRARNLLPAEGEVSVNRRQREAVQVVSRELEAAAAERDMLLAAESLRLARSALDRVTGRAGVDDMLDALFGRFCIGK